MDRTLLVFDFDHTLIDDNVDISVTKLAPGGEMPEEVESLYSDDGWTKYMGAVFQYLHENGVSAADIRKHVEQLPLTTGMKELFEYVQKAGGFESIIISDANSVFIQYILEYCGLDMAISQVFTNPAEFNSAGCLTISNFHTQDWCPLSTVNLCKGHILQDFIQRRVAEGVHYSRVLYIGDGSNDFCPGLTLRAQDYLLPRKGFSLWKKLEENKEKPESKRRQVAASVMGWDSAHEIRILLENIAEKKSKK
ncbi:hypothetical protein BaRGS_00029414 [Batillaria attramentaria]|uniref:Phosphatase n=1 Tax=Batillaria attramentaria TaxID=370345 RepID=A0ABD0JX96_9CAEN